MDSDPCSCKCHFGGAISCPDCKGNHEEGIQCKCDFGIDGFCKKYFSYS